MMDTQRGGEEDLSVYTSRRSDTRFSAKIKEKKREKEDHLSLSDRSGKLAATTEGKKEKRKAEEIIYNAVLSIRDRFSTVQDKKDGQGGGGFSVHRERMSDNKRGLTLLSRHIREGILVYSGNICGRSVLLGDTDCRRGPFIYNDNDKRNDNSRL